MMSSHGTTSRGSINDDDQLTDAEMIDPSELSDRGELLGSGSFGSVRKLHYNFVGDIAVKFVHQKISASHKKRRLTEDSLKEYRFMRKYASLHPKCVAAYGIVVDHPYYGLGFVMEFMPGGSLSSLLENNKKLIKECHAVEWMLHVTSALAFLHKHGVLHRDIKPHNILLSKDHSIAKICDFGLSRVEDFTMTAGRGTAAYIAPECLHNGILGKYDGKCDVYSCAMTFYQLLSPSGRLEHLPRKIGGEIEMYNNPNLRPVKIDCNTELWEIIEEGWATDRSLRLDAAKMFEKLKFVQQNYVWAVWEPFPYERCRSSSSSSASSSNGDSDTAYSDAYEAANDEDIYATCRQDVPEWDNSTTLQLVPDGPGDSGIDMRDDLIEYFTKVLTFDDAPNNADAKRRLADVDIENIISTAFNTDGATINHTAPSPSLESLLVNPASGTRGRSSVNAQKLIYLIEQLADYSSKIDVQVRNPDSTIVSTQETFGDFIERVVDCLHNVLLLETAHVHQKEVKQTTSAERLKHVLQLVKHAFITGRQPTANLLEKIHMELQILEITEVESSPQLEDTCLEILEFEDAVTVEKPEDEENLHL